MSTAQRTKEEQRERPVVETLRTVFLASIGALALTRDEVEQLVRRLVERGELAEKEARQLLDEVMAGRKETVEKWSRRLEERVEAVLRRLDVPQRSDMEALEKRLRALERKLDALSAQLEKRE